MDTANYPTAYDEPLTGDGIAAALKADLKRSDLCVRTNIRFSVSPSLCILFLTFARRYTLSLGRQNQTKFTAVWAHETDKIASNPDPSIVD